jgi:hypothetical protein
MHACLVQYRDAGYDGVFIPDHRSALYQAWQIPDIHNYVDGRWQSY